MADSQSPYVSDLWRGLPPIARAIFMLGAPTVAAGWLIYLMSLDIRTDLRDIRIQMTSHAQSTANLYERMAEDRGAQNAKLDVLIRLAQTQCVNAASDVLQRRDCFNAAAGAIR